MTTLAQIVLYGGKRATGGGVQIPGDDLHQGTERELVIFAVWEESTCCRGDG